MHYASLEEVSKKKFMAKQFTIVTTHKNVQNYYNENCTYKYTLQFAICTKSMKLFKLCSKEEANFFLSFFYLLN